MGKGQEGLSMLCDIAGPFLNQGAALFVPIRLGFKMSHHQTDKFAEPKTESWTRMRTSGNRRGQFFHSLPVLTRDDPKWKHTKADNHNKNQVRHRQARVTYIHTKPKHRDNKKPKGATRLPKSTNFPETQS